MLGIVLSMHKIPWKTVGLMAVVTLVTLFVVFKVNPFGVASIVGPNQAPA